MPAPRPPAVLSPARSASPKTDCGRQKMNRLGLTAAQKLLPLEYNATLFDGVRIVYLHPLGLWADELCSE